MHRAIITFGIFILIAGRLAAFAQDTKERRPDIKITRDRDKTKVGTPSVKKAGKENLKEERKDDKNKKDTKETLSGDDAQVIANMELLQHMDLLQNYDKVTLLKLFTPDDQKARARDKALKDQRKGQRSDEKNNRN